MLVHVYDTHITSTEGKYLHFDILVPQENVDHVPEYMKQWLDSIGVTASHAKQNRCSYCHSEQASDEIIKEIDSQGYYIIQMAGCPKTVQA